MMEFQSLFFWMMPTGLSFRVRQRPCSRVSILVLLDDAYRQYTDAGKVKTQLVSILVLLDDAYRPNIMDFSAIT